MQNHKRTLFFVTFIAFAIGIVAIFASFRQLAQDNSQLQNDEQPTPIQEGVLTDKQRKHSKLYKRPKDAKGFSGTKDVRRIIYSPYAER